MTDDMAWSVDQIKDLTAVGEREYKRGKTPEPFVGKRHPSFALSQRRSHRAVGVNKGLRQKPTRLLFPDPLAGRIDGFHELQNRVLIKASCKISTGGRIRDPLCSQTIQERFIIATQLDILQPLTLEQGIVSEVQHVITLVIGQMPLEQLQPAIDFLG